MATATLSNGITPTKLQKHFQFRQITSIHNFRPVGAQNGIECKRFLFRSSRPDLLHADEVEEFMDLGINSIIDLRSHQEFLFVDGNKYLQKKGLYTTCIVDLPKKRNYRPAEEVSYTVNRDLMRNENGSSARNHYLINFYEKEYIISIIKRAPWYAKILSVFVFLFDVIFRTHFYYLVRLFAYFVLNPAGLAGTYIDILELSQTSICAALKLLTKKENLPALINCAHGKDRTGITSALILLLLGETIENVIEDYTMSEKELAAIKPRLHDEIIKRFSFDESFLYAKQGTLKTALKHINDKYGSVENYLESIGFSRSEQQHLRENLGYRTKFIADTFN
ncbi:uncharacterized protein LOC132564143 [Ylistrum balloti]|uniref:uncharacterized protein LOC132564143 n=1 Tax=Ylistrum balloti TaxID=509963 RepID=UPI002905A3D5|nr:uncharacterized protein LOC132564143 [Ylistrum balloti]